MILNEDEPAVKFYMKLLKTSHVCILGEKNDSNNFATITWHLEWESKP